MNREERMNTSIREAVMAALLLSLLPVLVAASPEVSPYQANDYIPRPTIMRPQPLVPTPGLPWPTSATMRPISPVPYGIRGRSYPLRSHPGGHNVGSSASPAAILPSPCTNPWPFHRMRTPVPQPTAPDPYQMSGVHPRRVAYDPLNRAMLGVREGCVEWG